MMRAISLPHVVAGQAVPRAPAPGSRSRPSPSVWAGSLLPRCPHGRRGGTSGGLCQQRQPLEFRCGRGVVAAAAEAGARHPWETAEGGVVFSCEELAAATGGALVRPAAKGAVCTDTRALRPGEWFLVLKGANFDGHNFLATAAERGCAGAIAEHVPEGWEGGFIQVADGEAALQALAGDVRRRFSGPVVGITGSTGKTTARAMAALALEPLGRVHQTVGNLNNHIGLPLTLLATPNDAAACVLEMGMSAPGEIDLLQGIARPTVRVVVNVGPVHLEGCGGTVEGVAACKEEMLAGAAPGDLCVLNGGDPLVRVMAVPEGCGVALFGPEGTQGADVWYSGVEAAGEAGLSTKFTLETAGGERADVLVASPGAHLAPNGACAAAVAGAAGVPLSAAADAIASYQPVGMRMKVERVPLPGGRGGGHVTLLNDCYNSSPASLEAALRTLAGAARATGGRAVAALGDMFELGGEEAAAHARALDLCRDLGLDVVAIAGAAFGAAHSAAMEGGGAAAVEKQEEGGFVAPGMAGASSEDVAGAVAAALKGGDVVLVKGSRGMRMEAVSEAVLALATQ